MKILRMIDISVATLINLSVFLFVATIFILVFFYPETAGEITAKFLRGFESIIKSK